MGNSKKDFLKKKTYLKKTKQMSDSNSLPPLGFAIRCKTGVQVYNGPSLDDKKDIQKNADLKIDSPNITSMQYSDDGKLFLIVDSEIGVQIYSTEQGKQLLT